MVIKTDAILKGDVWKRVLTELSPIFKGHKGRKNYNLFIFCASIGIMYDKQITKLEITESEENEDDHDITVPRTVLVNANQESGGKLDYMFQAAILSTKSITMDEEQRLELAFGEENDDDNDKNKDNKFSKIGFLVQFANYGATILNDLIGETVVESMENIKTFLCSTIEGNNFDIDAIPDDIWLEDI